MKAPDLRAELCQEYDRAKGVERAGASIETWLDDVPDQAAVAWVLDCVFVRFWEDTELVDHRLEPIRPRQPSGGAAPAGVPDR